MKYTTVKNIFSVKTDVMYFVQILFVFSFAFSLETLEKKLKGIDISYGIYIYHLLIINSLIMLKIKNQKYLIFIVLFTSIIISLFSWFFVEKKVLKFKKKSFKNV